MILIDNSLKAKCKYFFTLYYCYLKLKQHITIKIFSPLHGFPCYRPIFISKLSLMYQNFREGLKKF